MDYQGSYSDLFADKILFQHFQVAEKKVEAYSQVHFFQEEIMHFVVKSLFSEDCPGKWHMVMADDGTKQLSLALKHRQYLENYMNICGY